MIATSTDIENNYNMNMRSHNNGSPSFFSLLVFSLYVASPNSNYKRDLYSMSFNKKKLGLMLQSNHP